MATTDTESPDQADALDSAGNGADSDFSNDAVGSTHSSCRTYIEIVVVDEDGNPVNKGKYRLVLTDGSIQEGDLPGDGRIRVDSIPHGTCDFKLYKMLEFGTPDEEVQRARDWDSSQGESPNVGSSEDGGSNDDGGDSGEEDPAEDEN